MSYPEGDPGSRSGAADSAGIGYVDEHLVLSGSVMPAIEHLAMEWAGDRLAGHELARLAAVRQLTELADRLTDMSVKAAAAHGATYAELAIALGISEPDARARWSGAIEASAALRRSAAEDAAR